MILCYKESHVHNFNATADWFKHIYLHLISTCKGIGKQVIPTLYIPAPEYNTHYLWAKQQYIKYICSNLFYKHTYIYIYIYEMEKNK